MEDHYLNHNANVARAMHTLGAEATAAFEAARARLGKFIGAQRSEEVVFTKNASEALNLCAHTLGARLKPGDEIVVSVMEHHSNLVPWQLLAERTGATLRWFDITDEGRLDLDAATRDGLLNERTKIVSVAYVSMCWARSTRSAGSPPSPMRSARSSSWTHPKPSRSCPSRWTDPVLICLPSPATKWWGLRGSVCCGGAMTCSRRCHRSWVGAR